MSLLNLKNQAFSKFLFIHKREILHLCLAVKNIKRVKLVNFIQMIQQSFSKGRFFYGNVNKINYRASI